MLKNCKINRAKGQFSDWGQYGGSSTQSYINGTMKTCFPCLERDLFPEGGGGGDKNGIQGRRNQIQKAGILEEEQAGQWGEGEGPKARGGEAAKGVQVQEEQLQWGRRCYFLCHSPLSLYCMCSSSSIALPSFTFRLSFYHVILLSVCSFSPSLCNFNLLIDLSLHVEASDHRCSLSSWEHVHSGALIPAALRNIVPPGTMNTVTTYTKRWAYDSV